MTCDELTNDQMLAPTAEGSSHLAGCEECRERQSAVTLAVRALRALADEQPVPDGNDLLIRAAIPELAALAARRRPAGWWQVAAAAAVLLAAVMGGLKFAADRETRPGQLIAERADEASAGATIKPPADPGGTRPMPPADPKTVTPADPTPPVKPPPDPDPALPPLGHGYLAGGELPPLPKPPVDPVPPPHLPDPAGLLTDVSVADCMDIMRTVLGEGEPVSRDLNGDGVTDVADALIAARHIAKEDLK